MQLRTTAIFIQERYSECNCQKGHAPISSSRHKMFGHVSVQFTQNHANQANIDFSKGSRKVHLSSGCIYMCEGMTYYTQTMQETRNAVSSKQVFTCRKHSDTTFFWSALAVHFKKIRKTTETSSILVPKQNVYSSGHEMFADVEEQIQCSATKDS